MTSKGEPCIPRDYIQRTLSKQPRVTTSCQTQTKACLDRASPLFTFHLCSASLCFKHHVCFKHHANQAHSQSQLLCDAVYTQVKLFHRPMCVCVVSVLLSCSINLTCSEFFFSANLHLQSGEGWPAWKPFIRHGHFFFVRVCVKWSTTLHKSTLGNDMCEIM